MVPASSGRQVHSGSRQFRRFRTTSAIADTAFRRSLTTDQLVSDLPVVGASNTLVMC
jgi:hypothetical protein